ncbi:MAG: class I SAM-dependent methyltransferase [bacterium]
MFAEKLLNMMNAGAASLMISIGHRTHLFDTMETMAPGTSQEIADAAGLNERYVREWLGAMVTSGIVVYDMMTDKYHLPEMHARMLTRTHEADNFATVMQYVGLLGTVEDKIVDCFYNGGGIPYSEYPRFQTVMADDSGQSVRSSLIDHILPLMPGMLERLEQGISVLDVGCGMGKAMILLAEHFPNSRFTGYDISEEGIASANAEAAGKGLCNVRFMIRDAATFRDREMYDLIMTFDSVHDQAKPDAMLKNIHRALRNDGVYLMQDIDAHSNVGENMEHPIGTFIYTVSCMHCMTVSLAEGGAGLGAAWGVELAEQMVREAGFSSVEIKRLPHDFQNCYYIIKK